MKQTNYSSKSLDHLGLIAGFCEEIGLSKLIDDRLPSCSKQKRVSYGKLVEAMLLNGLGFTSRTLHMYPDYFADKPIKRLLGENIEAEHLNDDALGRCLDALYDAGVSDLYQLLGEQVVKHLGLSCESINIDTTSFHVDGNYEVESDSRSIRLTKGYSRDHRPELNQVLLNLITENQAGIPLYMQACSGNATDVSTFKRFVKSHITSLKSAQRSRYLIGDSALYTRETIQVLAAKNQWFITRVPKKLKESKELLAHTNELDWQAVKEGYRGAWLNSNYGDIEQRWLVVASEQAKQRELKSLNRRVEKSVFKSKQSFKALCRCLFSCKEDALNALKKWELAQDYVIVTHQRFIEKKQHSRRGRPSINDEGKRTYQISGEISCCKQRQEEAKSTLGLFILSTNDISETLTMKSMLDHYKSQQAVERGFRFLKSPDFLVSSLFLKKPERIEALLMVMTCCLMIYAALEHKIRKALSLFNLYFPDMKKKPSQKPTARWVFQCFQGIEELCINEQQVVLVINLKERQKIIIQVLGQIYQKIYS